MIKFELNEELIEVVFHTYVDFGLTADPHTPLKDVSEEMDAYVG